MRPKRCENPIIRGVAAIVTVLACAGGASAATGPDVQERIVPGQAIGKVRIGMTLKEVKAALGQPEAVIGRERRSFTRTWVEYSWDFTTWRVGFQIYRGTYSVVSIRSSVRGEKTTEGVGYGTLASRLQRLYRTQCRPSWTTGGNVHSFQGYACPVRGGFFVVARLCASVPTAGRCPDRESRWAVVESGVLAPGEKPPFELSDFTDYYKPIP